MNQAMILSILRHVLTFLGGVAVAKGWLDSAAVEGVAGAVLTIAGAIWGAVEKTKR